ncbi:hypothetical protein M422DRAFT_244079 [Sphaerobolus stellatus SS14]|nr:hypothetical protein M422DRAFT_244079 [Sphaerobolus stellatus SS14]
MSDSETSNTSTSFTTAGVASSNTAVADCQTPESTQVLANAHSSVVETGINQYPNSDSSQDADSDDEYAPRAPKDQNLVKVDDKKGGTRVKGDR